MLSPMTVVGWFADRAARDPDAPPLTPMKVQKLLYYAQAWHLAVFGARLFDGRMEAWKDGPVCPPVYQALKVFGNKSVAGLSETPGEMPTREKLFVEGVWGRYGRLSAAELRAGSHREAPWADARARAGVRDGEPCREVITEDAMRAFYAGHVADEAVLHPFLDAAAVWEGAAQIADGRTVPGDVVIGKLLARGRKA